MSDHGHLIDNGSFSNHTDTVNNTPSDPFASILDCKTLHTFGKELHTFWAEIAYIMGRNCIHFGQKFHTF